MIENLFHSNAGSLDQGVYIKMLFLLPQANNQVKIKPFGMTALKKGI
jgi:hypothetical protein